MPTQDDWRRQGQKKYLKGINLSWKNIRNTDKTGNLIIVNFVVLNSWKVRGPDILTEGYASDDKYRWICKQCFADFRGEYEWKVDNAF